jgi:hypothetical protein
MLLYRFPEGPVPERIQRLKPPRDEVTGYTWLAPPGIPFPSGSFEELPWKPGLDDCFYRVIGEPSPLLAWRKPKESLSGAVFADLGELGKVPVQPALVDGFLLTLAGAPDPTRPASSYGRLAMRVDDRIRAWRELPEGSVEAAAAAVPSTDPEAVALARMALQSCHRLSEEVMFELGLLSTRTIPLLCDAAWAIPN